MAILDLKKQEMMLPQTRVGIILVHFFYFLFGLPIGLETSNFDKGSFSCTKLLFVRVSVIMLAPITKTSFLILQNQ